MGSGHSHVLTDDDQANLDQAKFMLQVLRNIPGLSVLDVWIHYLTLVDMAELLRTRERQGRRVLDVLCRGVTDSVSVIGASSTLRNHLGKITQKAAAVPDVGAFNDTDKSRLEKAMEEAQEDTSRAIRHGNFKCCAEHAVFEKLDRMGKQANYTYAVQKVPLNFPENRELEKLPSGVVRIVPRCANCKIAGGAASGSGPFPRTPRLGAVVTDHPNLDGLVVPVMSPAVLYYIRVELRGVNGATRQAIVQRFPNVRVRRTDPPIPLAAERIFPLMDDNDDDLETMFVRRHDEL
ncbi:hypothetical protein SELMODRAFT_430527 [Selaginella moellendorffii]|uniref:Uncharacterized protein n=1 Tax=Selaginella moellendorffii TaxID=88036 RepID=D8T9P2_SELML|nr:hypothetical protein SELMODRAFT_430527 [Selaginella moellendorffii]